MTDVLLTHNQWGRNIMANVSQQTSQSQQQQQKHQIYQKNTRRALPRLKNETSPRNVDQRKITVYRNGDRYFPGKSVNVNPTNYSSIGDLLQDLSSFVDLPYGVRRLFTPTKGSEVNDVNIIKDGASYVCASFEPFQKLEYSSIPVPRLTFNIEQFRHPFHDSPSSQRQSFRHLPSIPNSKFGATNSRLPVNSIVSQNLSTNGLVPNATQRKPFGKTNKYTFDLSQHKPRTVTIVKQGIEKPHKTITILLNRRTTQTYDQLLSDISEAFGYQKNRQDKVRRLFTLKGKQINGLNDLFREEDVFVAATNLSDPTQTDLQEINIEILNETHNSTSRGSIMPRNAAKGSVQSPADRDTPTTQPGLALGSLPIDLKKIGSVRDSGFLDDEDALSSRGSELTTSRKTPSKHLNGANKAYETVSEDAPTPSDLISRKMKRVPFKPNNLLTIDQQRERERQRLREDEERRKKLLIRKDPPNPQPAPMPKFEPLVLDLNSDDIHPPKSKTPTTMNGGLGRTFSPHFSTAAPQLGKILTKPTSTTPLPRISFPVNADENTPNNHGTENQTSLNPFLSTSMTKRVIKKRSTALYPSSTIVTDKYELGKKMGDGNFAVVHRSKLRGSEREYAIKIIEKKKMRGKEYMLDHEINIMYTCNHPNIIRLFEDYETPDEIYLVMELIKGGDLFDYITKRRRFDEQNASSMIKDVAEALLYLHAKKIVHRDLKPENLLVMQRKDGRITIKLTDFGLAMQVTGLIKTVCGTPTYVAPEILAEIGYGIEVDCWATGIILYILLCGYPPFKAVDRKQEELFQMIQRGKFTYEPEYWSSISATAKDLIDHLLVVDRHKRLRADEILLHQWILTEGQTKTVKNLDETRLLLRTKYEAKAKEYAAESTGL